MAERDWSSYRSWHELLDALCADKGYLDNLALADQFCAASGNRSQVAFETAVKNLRNWRHGVHIPQRRNFLLLGNILKIGQDDALRAHWNLLYGLAKSKTAPEPEVAASLESPASGPLKGRLELGDGVALALGLALSALFLWPARAPLVTDPVASLEAPQAEYVRNVSLRVGEALIIHGARGNECGEAPSWEVARELLPTLVTGRLSDGGPATRYSRQCGGRVPARAILFTAETAGTEQTSLYGDDVHIRVTE